MFSSLVEFFRERKIVLGLSIAVAIALFATSMSIWVYNTSDVSRLDVSRPGDEKLRQSLLKTDDKVKFDSTGELTPKAMDDFQKLFDEKRSALGGIGVFDNNVLSDKQLNLSVDE